MNTLKIKNLWIALILAGLLSISVMACAAQPTQPYNPFTLGMGCAELTGYLMPGVV